jgi:hypothetical protein
VPVVTNLPTAPDSPTEAPTPAGGGIAKKLIVAAVVAILVVIGLKVLAAWWRRGGGRRVITDLAEQGAVILADKVVDEVLGAA